jgi:hypothetical protein
MPNRNQYIYGKASKREEGVGSLIAFPLDPPEKPKSMFSDK